MDGDIFPAVISASSRSRFSECPQSFYREVIQGKRLKSTNFHLDAGKAYAFGLEVARRTFYDTRNSHIDATLREEIAIRRGFVALIQQYGSEDPPEHQGHKSLERIAGAYLEYHRLYPMATDRMQPMMKEDGTPAVEFSFVFDIPGTRHPDTGNPILYSGRADMLAIFDKGLWIYDDKTTGQMGATWRSQWTHRSQFTGYIYAAWQHNLKPIGTVVRGMALYKNDYKSEEAIVTRTVPQVNRWLDRLQHDVSRMVWHYKHNEWPHYGEENDTCNKYSGCAFSTLCASSNPAAYMDVYYKTYRWDPVEGKEIDPLHHPALQRFYAIS